MAWFRIFLAAAGVLFWHGWGGSWAAGKEPYAVQAVGPDGQPVELPAAPETLAKLLESGNVSFSFYDPAQQRRRYAGETKLDVRYDYRTTTRWELHREGGTQIVTVRPRFDRITLTRRHTVLLPMRMVGERFYSRPLVQHEMDHVRISTNPAFEKQFQRWIATEMRVLRLTLPEGQTLNNQWVQTQVKAATKQRFERMLELIEIRYQELDRLTDHGLQPLPADFFAQES